jgi:hypothetical protein
MIGGDDCEAVSAKNKWQGKPKARRKPAPLPLSPTDPVWLDLCSKPGLRCGKPATNRMGTVD